MISSGFKIDYINYLIVYFFNSCSAFYVFYKTMGLTLKMNKTTLCLELISSLVFVFLKTVSEPAAQAFLFLAMVLICTIYYGKINMGIVAVSLISVCLVHMIIFLSTFIVGSLFWVLHVSGRSFLVHIAIGIFQLLIIFLFLRIKRFRHGIQFFRNSKYCGLGLVISGIVFIIIYIDYHKEYLSDISFIIITIGVIMSGLGLYLWIKRSITAHYREKLQLQSEEHYQQLLAERKQENEKLNQTNEYLAKIVHRDNHLMSSLNNAIDVYFDGEDQEMKNDLFRELQTMVKERGELIGKEQRESKLLPSTGSLLIDNTVSDLFIKAAAHGIEFDLTVSTPVDEIIGKYISQTELQTLFSDHIKDAVIAIESRGEDKGKILVDLSMQNESYCITIYDSGVEFDIDTLSKLGAEQVTTHADSGGSGIGFMTTFETLRKAYASLIITEFENQAPFTKSVAFRFDGENNYIIQSYRSAELKERIQRDDVMIL